MEVLLKRKENNLVLKLFWVVVDGWLVGNSNNKANSVQLLLPSHLRNIMYKRRSMVNFPALLLDEVGLVVE